MSKYKFAICDVFTNRRFGGNQLAVLPEAEGLSTEQMEKIAREFNFSESTFVLPTEAPHTRKVRIFTPGGEIPFAGHPNIGTAFTLATNGVFGDIGDGLSVAFDEAAGTVDMGIRQESDGRIWCELAAPQALDLGATADVAMVADALSLRVSEIETARHEPVLAGVGLPFLIVELASVAALQRAKANHSVFEQLNETGLGSYMHLYVASHDEFDIRSRMFAPLDGIPEDPATGSANCALAALLTHLGVGDASGGSWRIAQGVEMGRPSILEARTRREDDVIKTWIGGHCVHVADGYIETASQ